MANSWKLGWIEWKWSSPPLGMNARLSIRSMGTIWSQEPPHNPRIWSVSIGIKRWEKVVKPFFIRFAFWACPNTLYTISTTILSRRHSITWNYWDKTQARFSRSWMIKGTPFTRCVTCTSHSTTWSGKHELFLWAICELLRSGGGQEQVPSALIISQL